MTSSRTSEDKILVLVVDIDDDLGRLSIGTPVVGYDNVMRAAIELGTRHPSDPDLNAIFQAMKIYSELRGSGRDVEIAIVTGKYGSLSASMVKVYEDLETIRGSVGFKYIYFVNDGAHDEQVLPVLQSVGKVVGVSRVVVEQSRNIEETYLLVGKYLRKAFFEQPYAKYFLGIPGLIMILYVATLLVGFAQHFWEMVALVIGVLLFVKGFGFLDRAIEYWSLSPAIGLTYGFGLALLVYSVIAFVALSIVYGLAVATIRLIIGATFLSVVVGVLLVIVSRVFYKAIKGYAHTIWRDAILIVPLTFFIMFVSSLNQRLASVSENGSVEDLLTAIFTQEVFMPLALAAIFTLAFSVLFAVLDFIILRRSAAKPPLS